MRPAAMIRVFWMVNFKPAFSLSSFTLIKRLYLLLDWYHQHIWDCWYFFWQPWFQLLSHSPPWHFAWFTLHNKLNAGWKYIVLLYSFPSFEPVHCSISGSNCCFLSCIQVSQDVCKVVWYSCLFESFPQFVVIHTVKDFSVVKEAEVVVFWNSLALPLIWWMLALWSLVPLPFLNPTCTSGSSQFTYCWSLAWRILTITLLACEMSTIVW